MKPQIEQAPDGHLSAIPYIRVSTDEQAAKGYSQRSQQERLLKHCLANNIIVERIVYEDYSAKTFKRPDWSKLMFELNHNNKSRPGLILFTRWDRFSRNTADAYYTINVLKKLDVEVQAIDQPLDLSVPENKILLAMYIVTSEVENDRRSLNVKYGIRKAKKEGRWIGHAPLGYINKISESGHKYIAIHEPEASIVRRAFHSITEDHITLSVCYKQSVIAGLKCSKSNFYLLMHNPVYCGKIVIPEFEDEKRFEVNGSHEPLISVHLFKDAQAVLKQHGRHIYKTICVEEKLPFRGFLKCPICLNKMTGSGSKGSLKRYYYYHCHCGYRVRADKFDYLFHDALRKLVPDDDYIVLFKDILIETYRDQFYKQEYSQVYIMKTIDKVIERSIKAKELLTSGEIDTDDYLAMKADCERRINIMGTELQNNMTNRTNKEESLNQIVKHLSHLDMVYQQANIIEKRKLLAILFPPAFIFDQLCLNNNFSFAIQHVFNLETPDFNKVRECEFLSDYEGTTQYESRCTKVLQIEQDKGRLLTKLQSLAIVNFLYKFAEINIKHK
jgi:DNA invertase Pin-like site-specific DNA recombinase